MGPCPSWWWAVAAAAWVGGFGGAQPWRSAADRAAARELVARGEGVFYFRHVRKSGGTSARKLLQEVAVRLQRRGGRPRLPSMTQLEWAAFPAACLAVAPRAFFVTIVRAPLRRIDSDFDYAGPGKAFLSRRYANRTRRAAAYADWVAHRPLVESTRGVLDREKYVDNIYVRLFAGRCEPPPASPAHDDPAVEKTQDAPNNKNKKKRLLLPPEIVEFDRFWGDGRTCRWAGEAWQGGCRVSDLGAVGEGDLALALNVLRDFDLVMVLEWADDKAYAAYLGAAFGLQQPLRLPRENSFRKPVTYARPPDLTATLQKQDRLDIRLYKDLVKTEGRNVAAALDKTPPGGQLFLAWKARVLATLADADG